MVRGNDVAIDLGLLSLVFQLRWEESIVVFVTFHRKRWSYRKCTYMRDSMYDSEESIRLPPMWPEFGYWIQCHFWVCWFSTLLLLYDFFHLKKNLVFVWSPSTLSIIRFTVLLREECHIAMKSRSPSLSHRPSLNILKMLRIQQRPTKMWPIRIGLITAMF